MDTRKFSGEVKGGQLNTDHITTECLFVLTLSAAERGGGVTTMKNHECLTFEVEVATREAVSIKYVFAKCNKQEHITYRLK